MNVMLIITLFILIFCVIQGYRRGLLGIVYGIVSWVFMIVFVAAVHTPIENFLRENTEIYDSIYEKTQEQVEKRTSSIGIEDGVSEWWSNLVGDLPDESDVTESLPDGVDLSMLNSLDSSYIAERQAEITNSVTTNIANFIMRGVGTICAVIVGTILMLLLRSLLRHIGALPVIKEVNSFAGVFVGAVEGILIIWVVMYLGALLINTSVGLSMIADIQASRFLAFLYDHNLIVTLVNYI